MRGYFSIVLHAHLPFVRHPEHEQFLEEDWLYEAISETYLPLLAIFHRLAGDRVPFRLTLTLSPTLVSMLGDELLMARYATRLDQTCDLTEKEVLRTVKDATFHPVAQFYRDHFAELRRAFHEDYRRDLVGAFASLGQAGYLEIITCCATHAFLPLLRDQPQSVRAQIAVGVGHHLRTFGCQPTGIWLPECGYFPGVEQTLAEQGIRFFFIDAHGLVHGNPQPVYGVYAPVYTEAGVAAFGRDPGSSQQVWSAVDGYPSDPEYREFYRDIGWDLEYAYVRPYIQTTGERKNTGLKYFRITGQTNRKQPYRPARAKRKAVAHASDFVATRRRQLEALSQKMENRQPIATAPYDAELFGHWWFEGPDFLEAVLRQSAEGSVRLATPPEFLRENPEQQISTPAMSSWGEQGYAGTWLDESNDWIYRRLYRCGEQMVALAEEFPTPNGLERRALNQAARELLLAQSSDWAFIIKTGTMVDYANRRVQNHVNAFQTLREGLRSRAIDAQLLERLESSNNIFPALDYRVYLDRTKGRSEESVAPRYREQKQVEIGEGEDLTDENR
jgi:1,4-alpha-glucan branching enzyme